MVVEVLYQMDNAVLARRIALCDYPEDVYFYLGIMAVFFGVPGDLQREMSAFVVSHLNRAE